MGKKFPPKELLGRASFLLGGDYANIFWKDIINKLKKKQREKVVPYTRFLSLLIMHKMKDEYGDGDVTLYPTQVFSVSNWALKANQPEEPPFTDHILAICSAAKLVHSTSLKQPSVSSEEATKGGSSKAPTGVTSEERANPHLNSGMPAFNLNKPIFSTSFTIHSEFASGDDASADSIAEADPGLFDPNDSIPQQQGMDEGTKNTSFHHISTGTDPRVLADQTKSVSEGLETVLTQPITGKGASSIARQVEEEEASNTIKLEDLAKLVNEDEEDEHKLEIKKNKVEAEAALLKAQPSFPNMGQLNELLVKSLQTEFSKMLSARDFCSSLPTELKDLSSKFNELTEEIKRLKKQVHELKIKLLRDLKEIPTKLEDFTKTVTNLTYQVGEMKTLQLELPAGFLSLPAQFDQVLDCASSKAEDQSVLSAGQADTMPAEGEKNINQAIISYLPKSSFQPKEGHIKKDKGKKAMSLEEAEKESTNSDSDDESHVTGSMVESSRIKKLKKFNFITKDGRHINLTEEEINHPKKLEEDAKLKQPNKKAK
ncbi:hypothetical protein Tco_1044982 [Tanacetum coccineum]|uniref:Uncharacterized protein n=1 Tax=Tanacetum coccineum TaxID=301880 RepID=A0ABQ5GRG4_9ASTR